MSNYDPSQIDVGIKRLEEGIRGIIKVSAKTFICKRRSPCDWIVVAEYTNNTEGAISVTSIDAVLIGALEEEYQRVVIKG